MKKNLKVVLIFLLIILVLVGLVFIMKDKISYNNKINFMDLVCVREYPETEDKEIITIKFDEKGVSKEYIETQVMYFSSSDEAKSIYEEAKSSSNESIDNQVNLFYDSKMELDDNIIRSSFYFAVDKDHEIYNKTREELIEYYQTEYMYECEN